MRAKSVIDFEYIGNDTSVMESVIGKSNKSQLDYQLNLRRHKDNTQFKPSKAWRYPANKEFGVLNTFIPVKALMESKLFNPKLHQHRDKMQVRDMN